MSSSKLETEKPICRDTESKKSMSYQVQHTKTTTTTKPTMEETRGISMSSVHGERMVSCRRS